MRVKLNYLYICQQQIGHCCKDRKNKMMKKRKKKKAYDHLKIITYLLTKNERKKKNDFITYDNSEIFIKRKKKTKTKEN